MEKIPVKRLSSEIYRQVKEELSLNSKIRLILEIRDNGVDTVLAFSEEEEQMLNELRGLDERALRALQKETESKLAACQDRY